MYHKLTDKVWFGNWESVVECAGEAQCIINVAHNFSERRGRNAYWQRLEAMPYTTLYYRIAKKDCEDVDDNYMLALTAAVDIAAHANKFPILTHCQMGGHRGPSAAIFVAWHLGGCTQAVLSLAHNRALQLHPGLAKGRNYYRSLLRYCERHSV